MTTLGSCLPSTKPFRESKTTYAITFFSLFTRILILKFVYPTHWINRCQIFYIHSSPLLRNQHLERRIFLSLNQLLLQKPRPFHPQMKFPLLWVFAIPCKNLVFLSPSLRHRTMDFHSWEVSSISASRLSCWMAVFLATTLCRYSPLYCSNPNSWSTLNHKLS